MENNIYNCEKSFRKGRLGEKLVYKWLINNDNIKEFYDTRYDERYQDIDVDFVAKLTDGQLCNIEVKTDFHTTGRLCYEITSCIETGSPGCMRKTKADILLYYFSGWDKMYKFNFKPFREWCEANLETKGIQFQKQTQTSLNNGSVYTTENRYFELSELEQHDFCKVCEHFSQRFK